MRDTCVLAALLLVTQGNALHYDGGTTLDTNMNPQGQGFIFYGAGSYFSKMPETGAWFNSDLRSGSPGFTSYLMPSNASMGTGMPMTRVKFQFRYIVGYGGHNDPQDPDSTFPVMDVYLVADVNETISGGHRIWSSGVLRNYEYDACPNRNISCYSPVVNVDATGFEVPHAQGQPMFVRFQFQNNKRNVQIPINKEVGMQVLVFHSPVSALSTGTVILLVFFLGCTLPYFGVGMLVNKYKGGKSGIDMVPNLAFWQALPGLIRAGHRFSWAKFAGSSAGAKLGFIDMGSQYENL